MELFELADAIGEAIKNEPCYKRFEAAKVAYEADETVQNALREYETDQEALTAEMVKDDKDTYTIDTLQKRINELFEQITTNERFVELNAAQSEVNSLMNQVNQRITFAITGEAPSDCTHDCSTCHGCH